MTTAISKVQPFLRWAGSKRKLLPKLAPYWGSGYSRYVEPFMGSASLFFFLSPSQAVLGDLNAGLVDTFICVKNQHRAVHEALSTIRKGKASYNKLRSMNLEGLTEIERCARFIFLNRFCFNGLFRTNSSGRFNVPYSPSKTGNLPTREELEQVSIALRHATIQCRDFAATLDGVQKGDFVYIDPPYAVANRRIFRQYGPHSFGLSDLTRLAENLRVIDARGAAFVVSYALCAEAVQIFAQWTIRRVVIPRNISGFAKHRRSAIEIIVSNIVGIDN